MCKKCFLSICSLVCVVLIGTHLSNSALAADSYTYYEVDPVVSVDLSTDSGIMPLSATSWDTADQTMLRDIRNSLCSVTSTSPGSVLYWLRDIASAMPDLTNLEGYSRDMAADLESIRQQTSNVNTYISNLDYLDQIYTELDGISDDTSVLDRVVTILSSISSDTTSIKSSSALTASSTNSLNGSFLYLFGTGSFVYPILVSEFATEWSFGQILGSIPSALTFDGTSSSSGERTLYGRIKQLQEVLASDDDLALANSQKSNREEIESSFLSGSSGSTSLGASDFGALSDVGGTVKDTISLNGQSSIGSFTDGLSGADSAGQGWFSESTRSALDSVPVTYDRSDPDPYNMSGWQERYAWLEGE